MWENRALNGRLAAGGGRTEAGVGAEAAGECGGTVRHGKMGLRAEGGQSGGGLREGLRGREGGGVAVRIERAVRGSREEGFALGRLQHARNHGVGHGAVVGAVSAAAGRQTGVVGLERGREGAKREEEDEDEGKRAPHL